MAEKSVIIIGAGVAGLTAGCYGQMNGYQTQIFEMDTKPGGLCTAWERKGYTIDGCLHWLIGTARNSSFYHLWKEVGVLHDQQVVDMEEYFRVEGNNGKVFTIYTDTDRLEKHLKEIAPEDTVFIEEFTRAIRHFTGLNMPVDKAPELYNALDGMSTAFKMLPFLGAFRKWGKLNMRDFSLRFKSPLLREAWQSIWPPEFSSIFLLITLAWMAQKNAGYIIGGSMQISRAMEKRYLDLGGKISYKSRVEKILVENHRAVGVKLVDGGEHRADYVISAADGHATIFDMLEGKYIDDKVRGYYENMPIFPPLVYIGLGVNRSFKDLPQVISGVSLPLDSPITVGNKEHKHMTVRIFNFDPTLAPTGKTVLTTLFETDYDYWTSLHKDVTRYKAEKEKIADAVVAALDKRFPSLASQVEMRDVATPVTFFRYTGNWKASFEGWLMTPQNMTLQMKKTLPGLDNFYMVGQWVSPGGGLPSGLMTGCHVVQILCKRDGEKFAVTS